MIDGPTPLHVIDAAKPGTGKGLLADVITIPATGQEAATTSLPKSEEERRKTITAALGEGPSHVNFDNLSDKLDSAALANVLTSPLWSDRLLGHSKRLHLSPRCVWLATGNSVKLSTEMKRRSVWIRLDSPLEQPDLRNPDEFLHHPLHVWALKHRGELIGAALTLVQNWIAKGRPAGSQILGRFDSWAAVMGGILEAADIPGLLSNAEEFRAATDETHGEWKALIPAWFQKFGTTEVGTKNLFPLLREHSLLPSFVSIEKGDDSAKKIFGKALATQEGACFGPFQIIAASNATRDGTRRFKLVVHSDNALQPDPCGDGI